MRILSVLAQATISVTFMAAPVFATDLGTYRPGTPYHSVNAAGADICASHCSGDAQCRGWNFVKVNPRAPGICEFNSKWATPISSAISISGDGATEPTRGLIQGSTNTIRVGTATRPVSKPAPRTRQAVVQKKPMSNAPRTRIVREPVPQNRMSPTRAVNKRVIQPTTSNAGMSLTEQQNRRRSQHARSSSPQQASPQQTSPQQAHAPRPQAQPRRAMPAANGAQPRLMHDPRIAQPRQGQPLYRHSLDGGHPMNSQGMNRGAPQAQRPIIQPQYQQRQTVPPQFARQPKPAQMQRSSVNNPVTMRSPNPMQQVNRPPAQPQAYAPALNAAQAQQSLFGRLNDDVRAPKPLTRVPVDPNMPIQTMEPRPTQPVRQEPLSGLAGAR